MKNRYSGTTQNIRAEADIAGFATELSRLTATTDLAELRLAVPSAVRIREDRIEWRLDDANNWEEGRPAGKCLEAFMRLADAEDDERFATFVRQFGVLGLRQYGTWDLWLPGTADNQLPEYIPPRGPEVWYWEPIKQWRLRARHARAIVSIATDLRKGISGVPRRWEDLGDLGDIPDEWKNLSDQRGILAQIVTNDWLDYAGMRPRMRWTGDRPHLDFALHRVGSSWPDNTLFSVLTARLVAFLGSSARTKECEQCHCPFEPHGRQKYCCKECTRIADNMRHSVWIANYRAEKGATEAANASVVTARFDSQEGR